MRFLGYFGVVLCATAGLAGAQTINAVAVSPDGTGLLVAGDNRVLYTLDPSDLSVTDRAYVPGEIEWMEFSADGRTVYFRHDDETFVARAAGSNKQRFTMEGIDEVSYAPDANRILLMEDNYKEAVLHLLQAANGKVLKTITIKDIDAEQVSLSADGSYALVLTDSDKSETEEKKDVPSDLKNHDKYLFRQQNDGYVSNVLKVDMRTGEFTTVETFYKVSYPKQIRSTENGMVIVKDRGDSAFVTADGVATMIDMGEDYISYARLSDDGTTMMLASGTEVAFSPMQDGGVSSTKRELDAGRMPGPSERVTAVDEAGDGTLYFGTSAYRIWKIAPGSDKIEAAPVF